MQQNLTNVTICSKFLTTPCNIIFIFLCRQPHNSIERCHSVCVCVCVMQVAGDSFWFWPPLWVRVLAAAAARGQFEFRPIAAARAHASAAFQLHSRQSKRPNKKRSRTLQVTPHHSAMGGCVCVHSTAHVLLKRAHHSPLLPLSPSSSAAAAATAASLKILVEAGCHVDKGDVIASSETKTPNLQSQTLNPKP